MHERSSLIVSVERLNFDNDVFTYVPALYLVLVATIAAFVGQHVVRRVINVLGRASIIIFILASTIFISAISLGEHPPSFIFLWMA